MSRWKNIGLSVRVYAILSALIAVMLAGGAAAAWYAGRIEALVKSMMEKDVEALQAARELQTALISQKGFVTYYYVDGNPDWLEKLEHNKADFDNALERARRLTFTENEKGILDRIEKDYREYSAARDEVIALYRVREREKGQEMHWKLRVDFFGIIDLTEQYRELYSNNIIRAQEETRRKANHITGIITAVTTAGAALGALLAFVLATQVISPIRRMTEAAYQAEDRPAKPRNEMAALSRRMHGLIEDVDTTRKELEQSREMLFHSEKMAVLGKLSTEIAHSIRNPMTSINMRLFSLKRSAALTPGQKEDLEVVAEEMHRLDNIVRNFLEFSRPPKLKTQRVLLTDLVTMTLDLLQHRLKLARVQVERRTQPDLPEIEGDPDLLKEVLVNLIVNACDSMAETGGRLIIREEEALAEHIGRTVMVQVKDTGPGIPGEIRGRLFEPFFTTKPEGTGLGLSIASRIIDEHGGVLDVWSAEGEGATFTISIPAPENEEGT